MIKKDNPNINIDNLEIHKLPKIPYHHCPLNDEDKNCDLCPLNPINLLPFAIAATKSFNSDTGENCTIEEMMECIVYDLSNDPKTLLQYIKSSKEFLKNKGYDTDN